MSCSIDEGVDNAEERLEALRAVKEKFPDATLERLPGGDYAWFSHKVTAHVSKIHVIGREDGRSYFYLYAEVRGIRVYAEVSVWHYDVRNVLDRLERDHPVAFSQLIECIQSCKP